MPETPPLLQTQRELQDMANPKLVRFLTESDNELGLSSVKGSLCVAENRCRLISRDTAEDTQDDAGSQSRVKAIQSILTATCLQLLIVAGSSTLMIQAGYEFSRLYLLIGILFCGFAAYQVNKLSGRLSTGLVTLGFIVYTIGLIAFICLLTSFVTKQSIFDGLIQLSVACSGLTCYAWTTSFNNWSHVEESIFCAVPCLLSTMVFWIVLSQSLVPLIISLACVMIWTLALAECTKDIMIPASSLSQLLTDLVCLHLSAVDRIKFLAVHRIRRAYEKLNIL